MKQSNPKMINEFWFSARVRPLRFRSTPAFDREIRERYLPLWENARDGQLAPWQTTAEGCVALVVVLDQFPLHMFRGQPTAFSTEQQARAVAEHAIKHGLDQNLPGEMKAFLYLPFMHSETLADQERSVQLYQAACLHENLRWARHHRELIRRFGRFPHRNAILNRDSTPEEMDYLNSKHAFSG